LHGNLDYLEMSESKKKVLRRIAVLTKSIPQPWRRKILVKIAERV